jgi:hypothetical protein
MINKNAPNAMIEKPHKFTLDHVQKMSDNYHGFASSEGKTIQKVKSDSESLLVLFTDMTWVKISKTSPYDDYDGCIYLSTSKGSEPLEVLNDLVNLNLITNEERDIEWSVIKEAQEKIRVKFERQEFLRLKEKFEGGGK